MVNFSEIAQLTKDCYKQRQEATNINNSPEEIRANHAAWNSFESQLKTFKVATNLSWIDWSKVESLLDVGCGYGNFSEFLIKEKQYQGRYLGIDIIPDFIDKARQLYEEKYSSRFITGNFLELDWTQEKFDVVISMGVLGVNQDYPEPYGIKSLEYAQKTIELIARLAVSAISLYFPNADNIDASKIKPRMAYYKVSEIEKMVLKACGSRCEDITFISFPNQDNVKTISKIKLSI
ncbi:MAG: class I SAM-dependent methyltransferase [Symploca sp. SIO2G7]|nr:class I SAM-dependent methyltransferase [Symploca sp. SIO2G7]